MSKIIWGQLIDGSNDYSDLILELNLGKYSQEQLNYIDVDGFTPLCYAVIYGTSELCEAFINAGANPKYRIVDEGTLLHVAAVMNRESEIRDLLILSGVNINMVNDNGENPIELAQRKHHTVFLKDIDSAALAISSRLYSHLAELKSHTEHLVKLLVARVEAVEALLEEPPEDSAIPLLEVDPVGMGDDVA